MLCETLHLKYAYLTVSLPVGIVTIVNISIWQVSQTLSMPFTSFIPLSLIALNNGQCGLLASGDIHILLQ